MTEPCEFKQFAVLKPGDSVLLTMREGRMFTVQQAEAIKAELKERFPGVTFTVMDGLELSAVLGSDR